METHDDSEGRVVMELFEFVPYVFLLLLAGAVVYFYFGYYKLRTSPPTNEPVLGQYRISLMGQGTVIEGLLTTARHQVDEAYLFKIAQKKPEVKKLREIFNKLHLYAIRHGGEKILVLSNHTLETQEYADSPEEGTVYKFPFGPISYRNVYGYGTLSHKSKLPTLFNFFQSEWDGVVFLYPRNLRTGKIDFDHASTLDDLSNIALLMKDAARNTDALDAQVQVADLLQDRLTEAYDKLAEQTDKANLASQRASLSSPFSGEKMGEEEEGEGGLPSLTRGRLILMGIGGVIGYYKLPGVLNVAPNGGFLLGAAIVYGLIALFQSDLLS